MDTEPAGVLGSGFRASQRFRHFHQSGYVISTASAYNECSRYDDAIVARIFFFIDRPALSLSPGLLGGPPCLVPFVSTQEVLWGRVCPEEGLLVRSVFVGKKLYVGNLSYSVDNTQLEEMFSKFGEVRSAEVVQDRDTGRSKGFGFVEMADDNAALEAIEGLNSREHDGRALTVNEARPKEDRGSREYSGGRNGRSSSAYGGR